MDSDKIAQKKFKESDNTAVFTTRFVLEGKDITIVYHDIEDGAWQFFSDDHFENYEDVAKVVGLGEIVKIDSSVLEFADLKTGILLIEIIKETIGLSRGINNRAAPNIGGYGMQFT